MTDPAKSDTTLPGYSARCRPCNSPHRAEVDRRLLEGESARAVSTWLAEAHGEHLPHQGLLNHLNAHLNVRAEAAAIVHAAAPAYAAAVQKVVADAGVLDEVASVALEAARALLPIVKSGKAPMAAAVAFTGCLSNARAAVTDRHELLHGKRLEVTGATGEDASPEVLHARLAALAARATGAADPGGAGAPEPGGAH